VPSSRPYTASEPDLTSEHGPIHVDAYPNTDSPGQTPECSAGNEPFPADKPVIGNPSGNVGHATERTARGGT